VDGTAGTGETFLIWAISYALREMYGDDLAGKNPVVRLAPTGIAAFGISSWTINFGMSHCVFSNVSNNEIGGTAERTQKDCCQSS
jgi:hypothetical protein